MTPQVAALVWKQLTVARKPRPEPILINVPRELIGKTHERLVGDASLLKGMALCIRGNVTGLGGDTSELWGDVSWISGDATGIKAHTADIIALLRRRK